MSGIIYEGGESHCFMDIDKALNKIQEATEDIKDAETLSESLNKYEEARDLIKRCEQVLDDVEQRITVEEID